MSNLNPITNKDELESAIIDKLNMLLTINFPNTIGTCIYKLGKNGSGKFLMNDFKDDFIMLPQDKKFQIIHELNTIIITCKSQFLKKQ